jgi:hypothetical protein
VFYVAADTKDNWAVVDGLQRMSTMIDFADDRFQLSGLEYLTVFEGAKFSDLPRAMQRRINETQLLIHVITQARLKRLCSTFSVELILAGLD